jgi:hypothetical protein
VPAIAAGPASSLRCPRLPLVAALVAVRSPACLPACLLSAQPLHVAAAAFCQPLFLILPDHCISE